MQFARLLVCLQIWGFQNAYPVPLKCPGGLRPSRVPRSELLSTNVPPETQHAVTSQGLESSWDVGMAMVGEAHGKRNEVKNEDE